MFTEEPESAVVKIHDSHTLHCRTSPSADNTRWKFNGEYGVDWRCGGGGVGYYARGFRFGEGNDTPHCRTSQSEQSTRWKFNGEY